MPDIVASDKLGNVIGTFAHVGANPSEMRCALSPGTHGFPAHDIYCHAGDGSVYRISSDGVNVDLIACLPFNRLAHWTDGALAFDTVGTFGYALLVASGGSGCQCQ